MRHGKYAEYEFKIIKYLIENSIEVYGLRDIFPNITKAHFHESLRDLLKIPRSSYNDVITKLVKKEIVVKISFNDTNYSVVLGLTESGLKYFKSIS